MGHQHAHFPAMEIKGFIKSSLLEWEGCVSCVLFLPLWNLRCRYCHAGHLLDAARCGPVCAREGRDWAQPRLPAPGKRPVGFVS